MDSKRIAHYEILEKIGEGGMGEVYLAHDTRLDRQVALKFLPAGLTGGDQSARERFLREARAASRLTHSNIVALHAIEEADGRDFIVMEYVAGESLRSVIARGDLKLPRALELIEQIASALAAAHEKGVVHRDIKAENVVLAEDGRAKVLDFGLAKIAGATPLTVSHSTVGTLAYMSPEQVRGEEVDHRSDLFSLGVLAYELITGKQPFRGEHKAAVSYSIVNEAPEPVSRYKSGVSEELERIIAKALSKDKKTRYQSAADFLADVRRLEGKSSDVVATPAAAAKRKFGARVIVPVVILVAVALALIFKPFEVTIQSDKPANASDNSIAIMYFDNLTDLEDRARYGEIVTNLLIADLSNVEGLRVVSSQRLYDILKLLDKEGAKQIDKTTASRVAQEAGAERMLLGSILQVEPNLVMTSQLIDVATGDVIEAEQVSGTKGATVFDVSADLAQRLHDDLNAGKVHNPLSRGDMASETTSEAAYRYYLEGWGYLQKNLKLNAVESFRKAVEYDSTFAMAWYRLGQPNLGVDRNERLSYVRKAYENLAHAGEKDQQYIRARYELMFGSTTEAVALYKSLLAKFPDEKEACYHLGNLYAYRLNEPDSAETYLRRTVAIDPRFTLGYNALAYLYMRSGRFEPAMAVVDKYIDIEPQSPNAYDTRAEILGIFGRFDEAVRTYEHVLDIDPDFLSAAWQMGHIYLLRREYVKAEFNYRRVMNVTSPFMLEGVDLDLKLIPLFQGKFNETEIALKESIARDEREGRRGDWHYVKLQMLYKTQAFRKNWDEALATARRLEGLREGQVGTNGVLIEAMIVAGRLDEARRALQSNPNTYLPMIEGRSYKDYVQGRLAFATGDYAAAASHFAKRWYSEYWMVYWRGRALLAGGEAAEAAIEFERAVEQYGVYRCVRPIESVLGYYYAGQAYEASGWNDKAIARYETFLECWKDADPGIEEVEDARQRLEVLRQGS